MDVIIYLCHRLTNVFSQMPFCRLIFVPSLNLPHLNISLISLNKSSLKLKTFSFFARLSFFS